MQNRNHQNVGGCPLSLGRREFLTAAGASALALKLDLLDFASSLFGQEPKPAGKPRIALMFVRPKDRSKYWMSWPGQGYDPDAWAATYTKKLSDAGKELGVQMEVQKEPLSDAADVEAAVARLKKSPPDGLIVIVQHLSWWKVADQLVKNRGDFPTLVFSQMGTSFTGHLQATRLIPKTFVAATQDSDWLNFGMRMMHTVWAMKNSRLCIVSGNKVSDQQLQPIGTTLHYIPSQRWLDELAKTETTDQVRAIADHYTKAAKKIVEPTAADILNAAKMYVVARRILAAEKCQGISLNCLPLVRAETVPCGPCLAWSKLNDEGIAAACEADRDALVSLRLNALLFQRPGFMQDPAPNTVNNTLMGAHCSCGTRLAGFDKPPEPFILRSHSEPNKGCAVQVLWRPGQEVTVWEFAGPGRIIVGTGRVAANIDTPPCGGCRTSVDLEMDMAPGADTRDVMGFHQLFVYGKLDSQLRAYCQLAGIEAVPIFKEPPKAPKA